MCCPDLLEESGEPRISKTLEWKVDEKNLFKKSSDFFLKCRCKCLENLKITQQLKSTKKNTPTHMIYLFRI